jgi:hypothetical protein
MRAGVRNTEAPVRARRVGTAQIRLARGAEIECDVGWRTPEPPRQFEAQEAAGESEGCPRFLDPIGVGPTPLVLDEDGAVRLKIGHIGDMGADHFDFDGLGHQAVKRFKGGPAA